MKWVTYNEDAYLYADGGSVKAVVFFIGGHVERPDSWYAKLGTDNSENGFPDLASAKEFVEEYYG